MKKINCLLYISFLWVFACNTQDNASNIKSLSSLQNAFKKEEKLCPYLKKYVDLAIKKVVLIDSLRLIFQARVASLPDSIYRKVRGKSTQDTIYGYVGPPIPTTKVEDQLMTREFEKDKAIVAYEMYINAQTNPDITIKKIKGIEQIPNICNCVRDLNKAVYHIGIKRKYTGNIAIFRCFKKGSTKKYSDYYLLQLIRWHGKSIKEPWSTCYIYMYLPKCE